MIYMLSEHSKKTQKKACHLNMHDINFEIHTPSLSMASLVLTSGHEMTMKQVKH